MKVYKISLGFDSDRLFGNFDTRRLDVEASAEKFDRLCRKALKTEYSEAEIEIIYQYQRDTNDLHPTSYQVLVNDQTDSDEIGNVELIRDRVHQELSWMVQRNWLNIWDAQHHSNVPGVFIRWMCEHGFVRNAIKERGTWEFTHDAFVNLVEHTNFDPRNASILCLNSDLSEIQKIEFHPNTLLQTHLNTLPKSISHLVIQAQDISPPTFTTENTSFYISIEREQISIQVDHFHDIECWRDVRWSYEIYVKEIIKQAQVKGIACGTNEDSNHKGKRIDSVWFRFQHRFAPDATLEELIEQDTETLFQALQDTDLSLSGGQVWKKDYEHNERLFCLEVLEPLLNQLGFTDVNYRGGRKEYGKDFTFSEQTVFGEYRHYGLQAKDGDMKGRVNSVVDEIIGQLEDAFSMPYKERDSDDEYS